MAATLRPSNRSAGSRPGLLVLDRGRQAATATRPTGIPRSAAGDSSLTFSQAAPCRCCAGSDLPGCVEGPQGEPPAGGLRYVGGTWAFFLFAIVERAFRMRTIRRITLWGCFALVSLTVLIYLADDLWARSRGRPVEQVKI